MAKSPDIDSAVNPFDVQGTWFKGNTHTHSTASDGAESPGDRFRRYRDAGYDFLVMTDHGVVSDVSRFTENGFLAISGCELHPANPFGGDMYHIVGVNVAGFIDAGPMHPQDAIDAVTAQGGAAIIAHPSWSGFALDDFKPLDGYCALEVYNETCRLQNGKGHSENTWDDHLDRLGPVWGVASDDAHADEADTLKAWIKLRAVALTPASVVEALKSGAFFSTQGPEFFDIRIETSGTRTIVDVQTSPVQSVAFKGRSRWGQHLLASPGTLLHCARYECNGQEKYLRIELIDEAGRKAWSNPFYLDGVQAGAAPTRS